MEMERMNRLPRDERVAVTALVSTGAGIFLALLLMNAGPGEGNLLLLLFPQLVITAIAVVINAVVCLALVRFATKSQGLATLAAIPITDLVYLNLVVHHLARQDRVEPLVMAIVPRAIVIFGAPLVVLGSAGFCRLGVVLWGPPQAQNLPQAAAADSSEAPDDVAGAR
jgi:hypothetical protein